MTTSVDYSSNTIIKIRNIKKSFFQNVVLKDINFDLYKGEVLSLVGENGAGKSTLMKIINGVYPSDKYEGSIYDEDDNIIKFSCIKDANDFGISMIYQEINVEYDLNVAENIMLGAWSKNKFGLLNWKSIYQKAQIILDRLGFSLDLNTPVRNLSVSQQQLICIARALVRNPKILILDEPTASLTENEMKLLFSVINTLKSQGISCIYISHRLAEVVDISDRVIVLRDGILVSTYAKSELNKNLIIRDMIGKDIKENTHENIQTDNKIEVLRVENVTLTNPHNKNLTIMKDANFSVYQGEIVGIAGMLGSGRSELLRSIYGVYPKTHGEIFINKKRVEINNVKNAIENQVGFLTEERKKDGFVGTMNIQHNASLNILSRLKSFAFFLNFKLEESIVSQFLKKMNYRGPDYQASILYLSGGNQQKVVFSKILMSNSNILLLDEPTRGIDVGAKQEIYNIIKQLRDEGKAIVIVSSEFSELTQLCSRILIIHKNRIEKELPRKEFDEESIIRIASFGS